MKRIYLDYASTTPIDSKVLEEMMPYLKKEYGNASSIHTFGQRARQGIDKARQQAADFLNCSVSEIIFTGSASESDNLAILGVVKAAKKRGIKNPHIITTQIEHPAVLEPCGILEKQGVEITYLPVDKQGLVKVEDVKQALKESTVLVSTMYANNEIGAIQPISEIADVIGNFSKSKCQNPNVKSNPKFKCQILFHTDAVQAINYLNCNVQQLGVDLLTLSSHKIYGPKGVGALYVKQGAKVDPIMFGGRQENGLRPGTENVAGIVGLGAAIDLIKNKTSRHSEAPSAEESPGLTKLRDKLIDGILEQIPKSRLNGSRKNRLPNNVNFSFEGAEGEAIVIALDQEGIAASTGSACSSGSLEPSHVLLALGLTELQAHGSLRLTLGRYTTEQEIDRVLDVLPKIIERLRKVSGFKF